jgi:hypothetical protein
MKKILFVLLLVTIITAGTAFAEPDGLGIGGLLRWQRTWDTEGGYPRDLAVSFKISGIPIYWAVNVPFVDPFRPWNPPPFSIGLSGDVYVLQGELVPDINLNYFLGLGAYVYYHGGLGTGGRFPIGLRWWPSDVFEVFLNAAPGLGVKLNPVKFPDGGFSIETGIRIWM